MKESYFRLLLLTIFLSATGSVTDEASDVRSTMCHVVDSNIHVL